MAKKKVSGLPVASTLTGSEKVMVVQGGQSKQTTVDELDNIAIGVKTVTGTSYAVTEDDNGFTILYTNNTGVAITLPNGLSSGHVTQHVKKGTGDLTFSATGTLEAVGTILATRYSAAVAIQEGSNVWGVYGNLTT